MNTRFIPKGRGCSTRLLDAAARRGCSTRLLDAAARRGCYDGGEVNTW